MYMYTYYCILIMYNVMYSVVCSTVFWLSSSQVTQLDQANVKAYFRRGQARQLLQDYEEAIGDFQEVLKLEPQNKAAQKQLATSKKRLKEEREKEKKRYANMFSKWGTDEEDEKRCVSVISLHMCMSNQFFLLLDQRKWTHLQSRKEKRAGKQKSRIQKTHPHRVQVNRISLWTKMNCLSCYYNIIEHLVFAFVHVLRNFCENFALYLWESMLIAENISRGES